MYGGCYPTRTVSRSHAGNYVSTTGKSCTADGMPAQILKLAYVLIRYPYGFRLCRSLMIFFEDEAILCVYVARVLDKMGLAR